MKSKLLANHFLYSFSPSVSNPNMPVSLSPRYFLYVILAFFVSGVHTAPSTTSFSTCLSCLESSQTTWASNPTATSSSSTVTSPSTTSTSMSTSFPERLGNCPSGSLSTSNSGSGLSSVSNTCGFEANSIYGFGNRLGVYLQWIGSLITYRFTPKEALGSGAANFIFQLCNFVRLIYISSKTDGNGGRAYAVESWIVLLICTGAIFPGLIMSPIRKIKPGSDPNSAEVPTNNEALQTVLSAATQLFAVWFVFKGMDEMFAPVNSRSAFAFTEVVSCWIDATNFS